MTEEAQAYESCVAHRTKIGPRSSFAAFLSGFGLKAKGGRRLLFVFKVTSSNRLVRSRVRNNLLLMA